MITTGISLDITNINVYIYIYTQVLDIGILLDISTIIIVWDTQLIIR